MLRLVVLAALATGCELVFPFNDPDASVGDTPPGDDASCGADLANDPLNCGSCGHACGGATCTAGLCQPIELATRPSPIADVEVSVSHVYWIEGGRIHRMSKEGGGIETLNAPNNVTAIAVDLSRLYWVENGVVRECLQASCDAGVVNGLCTTDGQLSVGDDFVGNTCIDTGVAYRTHKQQRMPESVITSLSVPAGIVVAGDDVFVADKGAGRLLVSRDGANPQPISNDDTVNIDQLAVDDSRVYWTGNNIIGATERIEATSTIQLTPANMPAAIAASGGRAYYVGGLNTGYLRQVDRAGVVTDLIPSLDVPVSVAVDDEFVYVLTSPGGVNRILKVAR